MKNPLLKEIAKIKDEKLRTEIGDYVEMHKHLYATQPAAHSFHHAYEGGLLVHIREIIDICEMFADRYEVNLDHLIAAAILHDAQKLWKYLPNHSGEHKPPYLYHTKHELFPMVDYCIKTGHDLPANVQYIIMSHMGGWTSIEVPPRSRDAMVFAAADSVSAYLEYPEIQGSARARNIPK